MVEGAFVGPIAILLTLGAVEMGRAVFAQAAITQAGPRAGDPGPTRREASSGVTDRARQLATVDQCLLIIRPILWDRVYDEGNLLGL